MLAEYVRLAFKTLRAYRLRSTLTVLSISIGVTAIILLVSLAQSGLSTLASGIERIGGTRFIMVWADSPRKAAKKKGDYLDGLTYGDCQALRTQLDGLERITGMMSSDGQVSVRRPGGTEKRTDFVRTDEVFLDSFAMPIADGRNLSREDLAEQRHVCVLGDELAHKLFGDEQAVGQELMLKGSRYRVVGKLAFSAKGGMSFGWDWNDVAIAPITLDNPASQLSMMAMTRRPDTGSDSVLDRANAILLHRHNQVDDFQFFDMGGALKGFYATFFAMILIVGLVAGMSLIIGGVGIMNIMLVAVAERRREIGLRKAVGATPGAIMNLFLIESVVLSLFGALIGTTVGIALAMLAKAVGPMINKGWVGVVSEPAIVIAILASAAIGLFFGWYPARQAATLDPILCLRSE